VHLKSSNGLWRSLKESLAAETVSALLAAAKKNTAFRRLVLRGRAGDRGSAEQVAACNAFNKEYGCERCSFQWL
jgi:hypothetical protein